MPICTRTTLFAFCAALMLLAGGCSLDRHVIRSTPAQPLSVSIVEVVSGEEVWSMDIPKNQQLLLDFGGDTASPFTFDRTPAIQFAWELQTTNNADEITTDSGTFDLTGRPIMMVVAITPGAAPVKTPTPPLSIEPATEPAPTITEPAPAEPQSEAMPMEPAPDDAWMLDEPAATDEVAPIDEPAATDEELDLVK
jgi:hypothetical protein